MTYKKKLSTKGTIAVVIIFLILFFGFVIGIVLWSNAETQKMLDKGCTPTSWNAYGTPSIWSCPVK